MLGILGNIIRDSCALLLGLFFAFVGAMKSFAPRATLAEHHAWTVWIPEPLERVIGFSELLCAVALAIPVVWRRQRPAQRAAAIVIIVNQVIAAIFHLGHGEVGALPQNVLFVAIAVTVALIGQRQINQ